MLGSVLFEPAFEDRDGGAEVVAERHEQVDVVEVLLAGEAVGEVVARVDGGQHFAAVRAEEAEVAFAHFGWRPVAAEGGDGDGHGQVVAKLTQQIRESWLSPGSVVDEVGFLLPVGLHEDAVDVVDVDGLVGGADGLDQAADAEVAGLAQDAVGGADDEVDGGCG